MHTLKHLFFALFALWPSLHAADSDSTEQAFYAVCALQYHVAALHAPAADMPPPETIAFGADDIAHLWHSACTCAATHADIIQAYACYTQAQTCKPAAPEFSRLCLQTRLHLAAAWQNLRLAATAETCQLETIAAHAKATAKHGAQEFDRHPFLDEAMRQRLLPHLIPPKHAAKKGLDSLFKQGNPIQHIYAFEAAGFTKIAQHSSLCMVARHPLLGGYLVKLYLFDTAAQKLNIPSWQAFCTRCESAAAIRALIKKHKMRHFSVADKWLYVVPAQVLANALPGQIPHPVVLVVEDMDLTGKHKSFDAWRSKITRRHLDELYCILSHGYGSAKLPQNVPYTKHHKFAFIDTEYPKRVVDYAKVKRFLTPQMQDYWDELVRKGQCPL